MLAWIATHFTLHFLFVFDQPDPPRGLMAFLSFAVAWVVYYNLGDKSKQ